MCAFTACYNASAFELRALHSSQAVPATSPTAVCDNLKYRPAMTSPALRLVLRRKLKQSAEQLLAPEQWQVLYSCRMLRTSRGKAFGLLVGSYGLGWHLWPAASGRIDAANHQVNISDVACLS
jgi:hypothetical protein